MGITRRSFFYAIMILFTLICVEVVSFLATRLLQGKGVFYKPIISESYEDYLSKEDMLLGWPFPSEFGKDGEYDLNGSRIIPAFPYKTMHQNCISLYGDSFTWSSEVDHKYAWSNVLSTLVNCRVANYGVEGYGSDQAYLRFKKNTNDSSKIVFLNHLSENILRNVNQFRDLLYPDNGLGFKPRFVINEVGSLNLIPLPTFNTSKYTDVVLHPAKYFRNEYFIPGGISGVTVATFPYTISVIKSFKHFKIRARLRDEPWYLDFYKKDHPSRGLEVTSEILASFHKDAIERGKVPVVTIIPTGKDLLYFLEHSVWPYERLISELSLRGISMFNFGEKIMSHINNNDPCVLFDNCFAHYNEEGNKMIAKIAYELLLERQLLGNIGTQDKPNKSNTVRKAFDEAKGATQD